MKLQKYVNLYTQILGSLNSVTELEESDRVNAANAILQEVSKDRRMREMSKRKNRKQGEPATEKQKKYLDSLGVAYPSDVSKEKASELISKHTEN